jgi:hypothetical protein
VEQPHILRGTKHFITRNNLEVYDNQPIGRGEKTFHHEDNLEVYDEQPIGQGEQNLPSLGTSWRYVRKNT